MVDESGYAELLDALYAAAVERDQWQAVIARFADLVCGAKAWMPDLDIVTGVGGGVIARVDPAEQDRYARHFAALNPFMQRTTRTPWPLAVLTDEDRFPKEEFTRTEYYNDFLAPQDIHSVLVVRLARHGGLQSTLNISRPRGKGQFSPADVQMARRLHPHLIRAFSLGRSLADLREREDGLIEALDRSLHGVVLVDEAGRITHANVVAQELLREGGGLRVVDGRLSACRSDLARRLEGLVAEAAHDGTGRTGGSMALPTPSRAFPLSLTIVPLRSERLPAPAGRGALVCIADVEAGVSPPVQHLAAVFGLTPAESRVALALFEGASPQDAARRLGLSPRTVHVHLARIFDKTGVNRQSQLVRVLMRLITTRPT